MWPVIVGAALGALRGKAQEEQANRDRMVSATKTRFSPWTGMVGADVKSPDRMGTMMQGAMAGAMFGQGMGGSSAGGQAPANVSPMGGLSGAGAQYGFNPYATQGGFDMRDRLYRG